MKASRSNFIILLKTRWSHGKSLCFLIPPFILFLAIAILAQVFQPGSGTGTIIGIAFKIAILICMSLEVLAFVCTLTWYFLNEVFIDEFERADKLISRLEPDERDSTFTLIATLEPDQEKTQIDSLVAQLLRAETLGAEALDRILMFVFLAVRLLVVFSLATVGLEFAHSLSGSHHSAFGQVAYSFDSVGGVLSIIEQSIYANITTLATVGFGDMAPQILSGRLLVDLEIIAAILFLSFGINMLVTLVMDSSVLAWSGRREVIEVHIQRSISQIRNVEGSTP